MDMFVKLIEDMARLWVKYGPMYIRGIGSTLALALIAGLHDDIIAAYEKAPAAVRADGRVSMTYSFALLRTGKVAEAEAILLANGGLAVTDIREGETSLTNLYIEVQKAKAAAEGITLDEADIDVPRQFDFRMHMPKKK